MNGYLADIHVLLWWLLEPEKLPRRAANELADWTVPMRYSLVSIWEVAIKTSLRKPGFDVDPMTVRDKLGAERFAELSLRPEHIAHVATLPWLHRDPFDRMLVAQAAVEKLTLLTADASLKRYGRFVRAV